MMKLTKEIEKRDYNVDELLEDEKDLLEELENSEASYICDAISELSDSYIPIYNSDLWKQAPDIQDSIEEAIERGLTEGLDNLMRVFQSGFYVYYTGVCHENLEHVAYNVLVNHFNNDNEIDDSEESEKAEDFKNQIEEIIEELAEEFDHNNSWDDLRGEFDEKLEELVEELEETEED